MTKIKCEYKENPYHGKILMGVKEPDDPQYCVHRGEDGYCTLDYIEMGEEDSGWVATCEMMSRPDSWY